MPRLSLTAEVLGEVFSEHGDALVAYFARRTFDPEVAFDLTAETFAEAVACRHRFRGEHIDQVIAWIYGIAANQLRTFVRRGHIERRALRRLGLERPSLTDSDLERIERDAGLQDLREVIAASLAQLPLHHREAVRLRVLEDRSYADTAAALQISEQTARAHVSRGLRRLAKVVPAATLTHLNEGRS
ncbi:hypothetical protein DSM112329_02916 [Paraconexibacter sp. AEG42_29]|uniref:Sigma-70 family RNA polymerase sigma factor n=1 Tax=Paraconexibacter sp. AEG42_29 TaxID=2997339 RepID=A0AAU7AX53_9ACTN